MMCLLLMMMMYRVYALQVRVMRSEEVKTVPLRVLLLLRLSMTGNVHTRILLWSQCSIKAEGLDAALI